MSQQINLFNPIFLKQKKHFSAVTMAQALGLIVLGSVLMAVYTHYQLAGLTTESATTSTKLKEAQAQLAMVNAQFAPRQKSKTVEEEIQIAEAEVKALQQVMDTLQKNDFGSTQGYAEYLRAFARQIVSGLWLTGLSIHGAGSEIGIQGRALQAEFIPAYIKRLKSEPMMQGKSFSTLDMHVPQVDAAVATATAPAKAREPARFIEFNLQSSGLVKAQDAPGAKSR